jgi:hypothetical protein
VTAPDERDRDREALEAFAGRLRRLLYSAMLASAGLGAAVAVLVPRVNMLLPVILWATAAVLYRRRRARG